MNPIVLLLGGAVLLTSLGCDPSIEATGKEDSSGYDADLAARFGADEYGMKAYVMAFLYAGPNRDRDSLAAAELQRGHLENIGRLAAAGKLVLAGPFTGGDSLRGIYVFDVATIEEARELTSTDPAIRAGSLVMDLKPWYGSAALVGLNEVHGKLESTGVTE